MIEPLSLSILTIPAFSTYIWFLLNVFGHFSLNLTTFYISLFIGSTLAYFLFWYKKKHHITVPHFTKLTGFLLIGILSVVLINVVFNYYWPPSTEFDALTMYDYRGKVFFLEHNITAINNSYHGSYPLYTSLAHTAMYFLGFLNPKNFYSIIFIAFIGVFFSWLYKHTKDLVLSLIGCLLLITTPAVLHHSLIAYTNFVYLAYMGGSLLYLADYLEGDRRSLVPLIVLTGITAWIRPANHPFVAVSILLLSLKALKNNHKKDIVLIVCTYLLFLLPWNYFQSGILKINSVESTNFILASSLLSKISGSVLPIVTALTANLVDLKYAGLSGICVLVIYLFTSFRSKSRLINPRTLVLISQLTVWCVLSFLIRSEYTNYNAWIGILYDSMQRLFIFFFPLIIGSGILLLK